MISDIPRYILVQVHIEGVIKHNIWDTFSLMTSALMLEDIGEYSPHYVPMHPYAVRLPRRAPKHWKLTIKMAHVEHACACTPNQVEAGQDEFIPKIWPERDDSYWKKESQLN